MVWILRTVTRSRDRLIKIVGSKRFECLTMIMLQSMLQGIQKIGCGWAPYE